MAQCHSHTTHRPNKMLVATAHNLKAQISYRPFYTHQKRFCHSSLVTCSWLSSFRTTGFISGHLSENLILPCPLNNAEVPAIVQL